MAQNNEIEAQKIDSEETFALLEKLYEEASNSELFKLLTKIDNVSLGGRESLERGKQINGCSN